MGSRLRLLVVLLASSSSLAACGSCAKEDGKTSAAPDVSAAPSAPRLGAASSAFRKIAFHGGPSGAIFRAARALPDMKDEQKATIDKLERDLAGQDSGRGETRELHGDLVLQVKAGKIDGPKNDARLATIEKQSQAQADKEAEALEALWAALEPAQRKAAVLDVRKKQGTPGDGGAIDAGAPPRRMERMVRDLDLDAGQLKAVEAIFAKDEAKGAELRGHEKKDVEALLDAFETADKLEAKKLAVFAGEAKRTRAPLERDAQLLAQVVPLLKPEQREKLAQRMDSLLLRRVGRGRDLGHPRPTEDPADDPSR
jgi:Spy/CpxP family protein refolding chaperone